MYDTSCDADCDRGCGFVIVQLNAEDLLCSHCGSRIGADFDVYHDQWDAYSMLVIRIVHRFMTLLNG